MQFPNERNINMTTSTKRVALPLDFVNIDSKIITQTGSVAGAIPKIVTFAGIVVGTVGVMTILNFVYTLASGH